MLHDVNSIQYEIFKWKKSQPPKIYNGANVTQLRFTNAICFVLIL